MLQEFMATKRSELLDRGERLGALAHQLRNLLNTTIVAVSAIKAGRVGFNGSTAAALDRSLRDMREVIDRVLGEARLDGTARGPREGIEMSTFIMDVQIDATLAAAGTGRGLVVEPIEAGMLVQADRHALTSLVEGLLRNAFDVAEGEGNVILTACSCNGRVLIEIATQRCAWAMGLPASVRGVGSDVDAVVGGRLYVRTMPAQGCVFTIDLPQEND